MGFFEKLDRHAKLIDGMAQRLGVDLAGQAHDYPAAMAESYRAALFGCTACKQAEDCAQWQLEHWHAEQPPSYCRNANWFKAFAAQ